MLRYEVEKKYFYNGLYTISVYICINTHSVQESTNGSKGTTQSINFLETHRRVVVSIVQWWVPGRYPCSVSYRNDSFGV